MAKFTLTRKWTMKNLREARMHTVDFAYTAGLEERYSNGRNLTYTHYLNDLIDEAVYGDPIVRITPEMGKARLAAYKCARLGKSLKSCGGEIKPQS